MTKPIRKLASILQFAVSVVVVLICITPVLADDYSRHCKQADNSTEVTLREGTYEGTWEEDLVFTFNMYGDKATQTYHYEGTFRITIDRTTPDGGAVATKDNSKLSGDVRFSQSMSGRGGSTNANQQTTGQGQLKLDGTVDQDRFYTKLSMNTSGQLTIVSPDRVTGRNDSASGEHDLRFVAEKADCNGAEGKVVHEAMDDFVKLMKQGKNKVTRQPARWRMTRIEDPSDAIQKLKEELQKAPSQGIIRTREAEARRLGTIADNIRKEPDDLQDCLWPIWTDHVKGMLEGYIATDTASLRSYNGDWQGLMSLGQQALEADRSLCLVGLDSCSEQLHNRLWDALGGAISRYLQRMVEGQAPIASILDVAKQGEILGVISPQLREQYWGAIRAEAKQWADIKWQTYLSAKGASSGLDNSAMLSALNQAVVAEKSANAVGVELSRALDELLRLQQGTQ